MTNGASKTGCFNSVLRRFLCAGGLPTHPSSDTTDNPNPKPKEELPAPLTRSTVPAGVVARLMGLDSLPASSPIMQKSRSVGSLDFFQIAKQSLYHRRSVSFREVPPVFLHGVGDLTPIQEESSKDLRVNSNKKRQTMKVKNEEEQVALKIRRKRGAKKNLDKYRNRRYNHPLPKVRKQERKEMKKVVVKRRESEYLLEEVCRLTMVEIQGGVWMVSNNLEEVSYDIGQHILQLLLYEIVGELSGQDLRLVGPH